MKTLRRILLVFVLLLIAARLALPELIKSKLNEKLENLPGGYWGHVAGVHLALIRGSITLKDVDIQDAAKKDLALTLKRLTIDVLWSQLIHKQLVADILITSPRLRLHVQKPLKTGEKLKKKAAAVKSATTTSGKPLNETLAALRPFAVRHFEIEDGALRLRPDGEDLEAGIHQDLNTPAYGDDVHKAFREGRITDFHLLIDNITNSKQFTGTTMAKGETHAHIMEDGRMEATLEVNPMIEAPTFDLKLNVEHVSLPDLNPLLRWQSGMDVQKGTFSTFIEVAAAEGKFKGYVKPFLHDLKMLGPKDKKKSKLKVMEEAVVGAVAHVFKNPETKNDASRIPFEGHFDNPKIGIWEAIVTVIQNGFLKALSPHFDKLIGIEGAREL